MTDQNNRIRRGQLIKDVNLTSLGWELALPIFGGALLGYGLNRAFGLSLYYVIGLILLGIFVGYYSLYRQIELELLRLKVANKTEASKRRAS